VTRTLITPLPVETVDGGVMVRGRRANYRIAADGDVKIRPVTRWQAYGRGVPGHAITFTTRGILPFKSEIVLTVVP
ncbi:MAG: hypothetical protein ACTSV1_05060, partial [Alphaproteobacteria bacterium]